jgi:hypothetical protein
MKLSITLIIYFLFSWASLSAQDTTKKKNPFSISGTMGVTYEGYGLSVNPSGSGIYSPRRPWNQLRFQFQPTMKWGKNFTLPFNFNFAAIPTNFAGPYSGFVSGGKGQTLGQWITNPMNNFGLNPKYKWAELLLGTQYLKYSDLSTGDIGIFGAGVSLHPGKFMFKFFTGVSQQGVNFTALPPPGIVGAYKRNHYMFQIGREVEGDHKVAFNFSKAKDDIGSVTSPPLTVLPQEGFTMSFILDKFFDKGWFMNMEAAQSFFTKDLNAPLLLLPGNLSFKPFIDARTSTTKDYAGQLSVGKKSTNFDISYASKYIGAGYQTTGYPFMQADHWDNTINTRFNAWKNKMNVTASVGQRVNNMSNTSLRGTQFLGNINWFTQFNERFSLNVNYNNFGFQTASGLNPYGIKNVSNDIGLSPTYTWSSTTMTNILTLSYNYSKYDERDVITNVTTSNNTHTAILTYVPVFFNKTLTPDFSLMYFNNRIPTLTNRLLTLSTSLGMPVAKQKIQLRGQLQYTLGKINAFTANNNIIASCNIDCKLNKRLSWNSFLSTNYFKYGDELGSIPLIGANYLESNLRTGLQYKF